MHEKIEIEKKTKRGTSTVDLKEHINIRSIECNDNCIVINVNLPAGGTLNINPELLIKAAEEIEEIRADYVAVVKEKLLTINGDIFC